LSAGALVSSMSTVATTPAQTAGTRELFGIGSLLLILLCSISHRADFGR
jgi:hypothetical protein